MNVIPFSWEKDPVKCKDMSWKHKNLTFRVQMRTLKNRLKRIYLTRKLLEDVYKMNFTSCLLSC